MSPPKHLHWIAGIMLGVASYLLACQALSTEAPSPANDGEVATIMAALGVTPTLVASVTSAPPPTVTSQIVTNESTSTVQAVTDVTATAQLVTPTRQTPTPVVTRSTPQVPPTLLVEYVPVSLQPLAQNSAPEANLGLTPGRHELLGIPFETGWTVTTQCADWPDYPTLLRWQTDIQGITAVYVLFQAGWATPEFFGGTIGNVALNFVHEHTERGLEIPFVLGSNVRDWSRDEQFAVATVTSPSVQEAWSGVASGGRRGGMDMLTIAIPTDLQPFNLVSIEIADTTVESIGSQSPCLHLLAVTIEHRQE